MHKVIQFLNASLTGLPEDMKNKEKYLYLCECSPDDGSHDSSLLRQMLPLFTAACSAIYYKLYGSAIITHCDVRSSHTTGRGETTRCL